MAHQWHAGVLTSSSWHGLEEIGAMVSAEDMIEHGERSNAWPLELTFQGLSTEGGLSVDSHRAVVGQYRSAAATVLGVVGGRYNATTPEAWRGLVHAAVLAGAKPTGCFALAGGSRVLATFDVGGNGIRTQLVIADSFDGSLRLTVGMTSVRVVCANTLALALRSDGREMAQLRHTAGLEGRTNALKSAIGESIALGESVKAKFEAAEATRLDKASFDSAFELLFPSAPEGATKIAQTRAEAARRDAVTAGRMAINRVGAQPGNVATLWNAATYLVDREVTGAARKCRSDADRLDSLLFGARAERIEEIARVIEVVMTDGSFRKMTVHEAFDAGMTPRSVAEGIVSDAMN